MASTRPEDHVDEHMEDCGALFLDDEFPELTSADFFRILADDDLSGDLPLLPETSASEDACISNGSRAGRPLQVAVNWQAIEDLEERRKQRRLAKNRVTAARSRERRKEQMVGMEERLAELEAENQQMRTLMAQLAQENQHLKEQLSSRASGAAAAAVDTQDAGIEPAVL
eukprot:gene513-785_t